MNLINNKKNLFIVGGVSVVTKVLFVAFMAYSASASAAPAPNSFADLAEKLLPSVVNISSTKKMEQQEQLPQGRAPFGNQQNMPQFPEGHPFNEFFNEFFDRHHNMVPPQQNQRHQYQTPLTASGSGFIIDIDKGWVITNNHVISGADEVKLTLHNDVILTAEVLGVDDKTDIALLKADLKGEKVSEVKFGDSDKMRVGDWVLAIGNPFGLGGTVTAGIISARQRDINSGPYDDYIQTDASINTGNSGGPMFNIDGEVIGINTAIFSPTGGSVGIGFAIPSVIADPVINQLGEFGRTKRGWLGVKIQDVTDEIAESLGLAKAAGALVAEVTKTGPAEKAGIQAGDIILAFDNKPIREMRNLPRIVAETNIDKKAQVIVWRNGKRVTLSADIGELEKAEDSGLISGDGGNYLDDETPKSIEPEGIEIPELGMTLKMLDDDLRDMYGVNSTVNGLVVLEVDNNSDAAKKGIGEGDVVIDINQQTIKSIADLQSKIMEARNNGRDSILLLINRQGSIQFVAVKIQGEQE